MTVLHVPLLPAVVRTTGSLLSFASHTALGELGAPAATQRTETQAPQTKGQPPGQTLLGARAPILVRLEEFSHHRRARDRGPLAPCRLPQVLESDLQGERASRKKEAIPGDPRSHLPNGDRQSDLGCSSDSRRAPHAGLRCIRAKHPRWMKRAPQDPGLARRWQAFLRNHREVITAMDFFTVPTVTFNLLYCLFNY
jgi:hypothetical protein